MIDFETYHAQKEELWRQSNIGLQSSGNPHAQKYIEHIQEQKRRDVDYIAWLLEKDAEKKRADRSH